MGNGTTQRRSRRAFLTQAGGVAAAALVPTAHAAAQPQARSASQARDRAIWATWYDLPEAGRDDHLAWVHQTYLPGLLKRPGYLWAAHYASIISGSYNSLKHTDDPAVPTGNAYIVVVGGEDANVFGNPTPDELHVSLDQDSRKMLAMRSGERTNIFVEAARVAGPAAKDYKDGMTLAPCIQLGSYNLDYRKEIDILAWYSQLFMPSTTVAAGCVRARKLASVVGWAKMGILYEFASVDLRNKFFGGGGRGGAPNKWQGSVSQLIHAPGAPNVARRIWPAPQG